MGYYHYVSSNGPRGNFIKINQVFLEIENSVSLPNLISEVCFWEAKVAKIAQRKEMNDYSVTTLSLDLETLQRFFTGSFLSWKQIFMIIAFT